MASPTPTIAEIVEKFGGELHGPGSVRIRQVATLRNADADQLAFFAGGAYASDLAVTRAGVVVLKPDAVDKTPQPRIVVANPYVYFARVSQWLNPPDAPAAGIHATAIVDPSAMIHASASIGPLVAVGARSTIGANTVIGAGSVIGDDCELGDDTCLYPRVTLYSRTRVGRRGIVHSGVVLGADGFGFANERGAWIKIPQIGGVSIGDDVEIGANTTIDRGALDDTVIEDGVKLDNQIQIGHNCRVGAHTAIAGCVGVAGSTSIGRYCMIGGASSISGHISIVDRVIIAGATSVAKSISEPGTYAGAWPFTNQRRWRRIAVQVRNIVELESRVKALERARSIRPPEPGNNDNN